MKLNCSNVITDETNFHKQKTENGEFSSTSQSITLQKSDINGCTERNKNCQSLHRHEDHIEST